MFLTDSTSDNSGHAATLCYAKISQGESSHIPKPLSEIVNFGRKRNENDTKKKIRR